MPIHCAFLVYTYFCTYPFKPRLVRLYHLQIGISLSNQIIDKIRLITLRQMFKVKTSINDCDLYINRKENI